MIQHKPEYNQVANRFGGQMYAFQEEAAALKGTRIITNYQPPITSNQLPIINHQSPTANYQPMNRIKAFYFCYFGAMAALMPFLVLYYEQIGLSGRQIAVLAALPPLMNLFAAALWNGVADAFNQHKRLQMVAIAGAIGMALLVSQF
ncbi:MAG: MFS transporter, partial [Caldilineaceae bacterium]|nr:MFS transporter [Caldilineaceae bacterium]